MRLTDYEARVLRSAILFPDDCLHKVAYSLEVDSFSNPVWRKAFLTLKDAVANGKSKSVELIDYLSENDVEVTPILKSWDSVYGAETIEEPIKTIKNRSRLEGLRKIYEQSLADVGKSTTDAEKQMTTTMSELSGIMGTVSERSMSKVVEDLKEHSLSYVGKSMFGVPYGLKAMDDITKGMQPGHLWLLGGYTSMGKSWYALRAMKEMVKAGKRVVYFSFEMGAEELIWRYAVMSINDPDVTIFKAKTRTFLSSDKQDLLDRTISNIPSLPMVIVDNLSSWEEVKLRIMHEIFAKGADAIIIDYIQNIMVMKATSEYETLNKIVLDCQTIARKNRVFVLALSQVNRESQRSKDTTVFGFKGSGNIENAADIAITLNPVEDLPLKRELVVGKNREGMTGEILCDIDFGYGSIKQCPMT